MKYKLVLEIINDTERFEKFKTAIINASIKGNNILKNKERIKATGSWKNIINDYKEFVDDFEKYYNNLKNDFKKHHPKAIIRNFERLKKNSFFDQKLKEIGYDGNYIEAAEILYIVLNFFTKVSSEEIDKENLTKEDINTINNLNIRLNNLSKQYPSVKA
jgi:hypothetical protein